MRRFTLLTVVLASAVTFLIGVIVAGGLTPGAVVSSAPRRAPAIGEATKTGGPRVVTGAVNFADVAERINAAVVNIDATAKTSRERRRGDETDPGRDYEGPRQGSGSGCMTGGYRPRTTFASCSQVMSDRSQPSAAGSAPSPPALPSSS